MQDYIVSIVRTVVPYLIGGVAAWLTTQGYYLSDATQAQLTAGLTFAFGAVYYIVVRAVEKKWPQLGWLIGSPVQPTYVAPTAPTTTK